MAIKKETVDQLLSGRDPRAFSRLMESIGVFRDVEL
jgi:hypothetical protein